MPLPQIKYPTYEAIVPSTGDKVKFRPFTVKEEKILLTALQGEDKKEILNAISEIVNACFFNKVKLEKLSTYDLEYLFLQLRIRSVSNTVDLQLRNQNCKENNGEPCEKAVLVKINLDDVKVQVQKEGTFSEFTPEKRTKHGFAIQLDDELGVTMKHPGVSEIEEVETLDNEYERISRLIELCITTVYDTETVTTAEEVTVEEIRTFYDSLLTQQKAKLIEFVKAIPRIRHEVKFKCKQCGFEEDVAFEGLQSFFG